MPKFVKKKTQDQNVMKKRPDPKPKPPSTPRLTAGQRRIYVVTTSNGINPTPRYRILGAFNTDIFLSPSSLNNLTPDYQLEMVRVSGRTAGTEFRSSRAIVLEALPESRHDIIIHHWVDEKIEAARCLGEIVFRAIAPDRGGLMSDMEDRRRLGREIEWKKDSDGILVAARCRRRRMIWRVEECVEVNGNLPVELNLGMEDVIDQLDDLALEDLDASTRPRG